MSEAIIVKLISGEELIGRASKGNDVQLMIINPMLIGKKQTLSFWLNGYPDIEEVAINKSSIISLLSAPEQITMKWKNKIKRKNI